MQTSNSTPVRYLTTKQKAEQLNVSESWLDHDRLKAEPTVPFVRIGSRMIRYPEAA